VSDRLGLSDFVLAVGDLGPRKNIPALAAAVSRLGGPELAIVGKPGHGGRSILAEAGGRWLGPVEDEVLAELYSAAMVVAVPSLYEGFGITALEAMACGAPVVVSDRGALPEVVGAAGIVVEPTADALAEGIAAATEPATADRLREAGPARAAEFSRDATGRAGWDAVNRAVA
jgi:glycosyltransferase involved in cell wall biosynthesis